MSLTRFQLIVIIGIAFAILIALSPHLEGAVISAAAAMTIADSLTKPGDSGTAGSPLRLRSPARPRRRWGRRR
jgi:hypothetical protein